VESEGFSTWGGGGENFNDSDSGLTFCSPIATVGTDRHRKDISREGPPVEYFFKISTQGQKVVKFSFPTRN